MKSSCPTSHYYDSLLSDCKPCYLRCPKLPTSCRDPCPGPSQSTAVLSTSVLITHEAEGADSQVIPNDTMYVYWLLLALFVVIIPTLLVIAIMLKRRQKLYGDYIHKDVDINENTSDNNVKGADLESVLYNNIKIPVPENEESGGPMYDNICDKALSDYLFPLPAVEEGAAILVTTKTSAFLNLGPDVRGNAFVET